jgi:hypothetical protein
MRVRIESEKTESNLQKRVNNVIRDRTDVFDIKYTYTKPMPLETVGQEVGGEYSAMIIFDGDEE